MQSHALTHLPVVNAFPFLTAFEPFAQLSDLFLRQIYPVLFQRFLELTDIYVSVSG